MTHWNFNPILGSYWLVACVTIGLLLLLLFGPTFRTISRRRRLVLVALRVAVILILLSTLLRPTVVSIARKPQSAVLLLLMDASRSMTLPSATAGLTRWQAQRETIARALAEFGSDDQQIEVRAYTYDAQLHAAPREAGQFALPPQPTGDQTDIGSSLDAAVREELGKRLAGAVLMGDGAQTAFAPRVEITAAGRELARLNCPLYTVAFGAPGDAGQSRDVAIENLPEQYTVFVKNELVVRGSMRVRGYVNQEIPVELLLEKANGQRQTLGAKRLIAREDDQLLPVELTYVPDQPGSYKLILRAAEQNGELVTRNNELSAYVNVLEGGLRTLYLYGDLLGEQRLLRRAIDMSPDIQLDDVYVDPRNRTQWPLDLSSYLSTPTFDVMLLESVDATALAEETQRDIALAVERGRGLLMIGGYQSFGAGGYAGKPLADVLPITIDRFERQDLGVNQPIIRDLHYWGDLTMIPARPHATTRLAPDDQNTEVWRTLPKLKGANRFRGLKPRAQVLLETPDNQPLLVAGEYGQGRVLAFAGNSTFRWWQFGRQPEYRRFWRQVILWLAKREESERNDVWVRLAQRRLPVGAAVTFSAGAKSPAGDRLENATYRAELVAPDGQRQPLTLSPNGDEVTGVVEDTAKPGDYRIEVQVSVQGRPAGTAQGNFQVLDRDIELSNPAADYNLFARLAWQTKEAGGRPVSPEELPQLLREIRQRQQDAEVEVQTKWQLGDTASSSWLLLLTFASLLTAEWYLRKTWGLV